MILTVVRFFSGASCLGLRPEAAEVASPTCLRPNVHRPAKGIALLKSQQQDLHCFSRSFLCGGYSQANGRVNLKTWKRNE